MKNYTACNILVRYIFLIAAFAPVAAFSQSTNLTISSPGASYATLAGSLSSDPNVVITNITGQRTNANQMAFFQNTGTNNLQLRSGIVFSTGNVTETNPVRNTWNNNSTGYSSAGAFMAPADPQLASVAGPWPYIYDHAIIEFDLKILVGNTMSFTYVFGSEEYPEYVCAVYNDAFGMWIQGGTEYPSYTNMATTPVGGNPVAVNNINGGAIGSQAWGNPCPTGWNQNTAYFINNANGLDVEADGLTVALVKNVALTPGVTYHFKIAIADIFDAALDAWVFIASDFSTLPVDLLSFNGTNLDADHVSLGWNVANERDFSHYVVQRSLNPTAGYEDVGTVRGNNLNRYSYVDYTEGADYYYRLKLVDLDGVFKYSDWIYVSSSSVKNTFNIKKDVNEEYSLTYNASHAHEGVLVIHELSGKEVFKRKVHLEKGYNVITIEEFEAIPSGIYIATFTNDESIRSVKVIK